MTIQKFTIHANINNEDVVLHPKTEVAQVEGFTQTVDDQIDAKVYPITNQEIYDKWEFLDPDFNLPVYITEQEVENYIETYVPQKITDTVSASYLIDYLTAEHLDLTDMDVSRKNKLSNLFAAFPNLKTVDVSNWNTSNVMDMSDLFSGKSMLTGVDVADWDTGNVRTMKGMFRSCDSLSSLDLSNWDVSHVTDMNSLFSGCSSLVSLDMTGWDTGEVTDMQYMFSYLTSLSSIDVTHFDTTKVEIFEDMFLGCMTLRSIDLSGWNTANATSMKYMLNGCGALEAVDLSRWASTADTPKDGMFSSSHKLRYLILDSPEILFTFKEYIFSIHPNFFLTILVPRDLISSYQSAEGWSMLMTNSAYSGHFVFRAIEDYTVTRANGQVTVITPLVDMHNYAAEHIANYTTVTALSPATVEALLGIKLAADASGAFEGMAKLASPPDLLETWDTSSVTNMSRMFKGCSQLYIEDDILDNWDTSQVTDMSEMFAGIKLNRPIFRSWNVENVITTNKMFKDCPGYYASIDLGSWNLCSCTDMSSMFENCWCTKIIDISNFDTSSVITNMTNMFSRMTELTYIIIDSPIFKFAMQDSSCGGLSDLNADFKVLVPSALLNTYRNATNWSLIAAKFDAIENYAISRSLSSGITVTPKT